MRARPSHLLALLVAVAAAWPQASAHSKETKPPKGPPKEWVPADEADARAKCARALDAAGKEAEKRKDRTTAGVLASISAVLAGQPAPAGPRVGPDSADSAWLDHALEPAGLSATLLVGAKGLDDVVAGQLVLLASQAVRAIRRLNTYRVAAGLPEILLDGPKCRGCILHARYMVLNGYDAVRKRVGTPHDEAQDDPYATDEGKEAARLSCMGQMPIDTGVDACMATLYHRPSLLIPDEQSVGMGWWQKGGKETYCLRVAGEPDPAYAGPTTVLFPGKGMVDVPCAFEPGGERPSPVPAGDSRRLGFPVTVTVYAGHADITDFHATLTASGAEVECVPSSPAAPSNPEAQAKFSDLTMALLPATALRPRTRYAVSARCLVDGAPWSSSWTFTTR